MKRTRVFSIALILAGCTSVPLGYPDGWPPMQPVQSKACPNLAGAYAEVGETSSSCKAGEPCRQLSFGLFDGMTGFEDRASLTGSKVEIRQPAADEIDIVVSDGDRERSHASLSSEYGDFRCTPRGLTLLPRDSRVVVVGGSVYREERTFNRASDGSLVMIREALGSDQGVVLPVTPHARYWARWAPSAARQ